ncbi:hypothetical protein [Flavobacterium davisii]|uniref:Uncharacterized protein n=1 Tax=Flavobacterium davisii TaxID=2906077 RepID=A0A246GLR0_9FLAO|nr:hypothetical protein [Flavobacterium davisii]OWP85331.1 hypothetical protein BWK59_00305 [Flavobacterium davisii]
MTLTIIDSTETFSTWLNREYIDEELQKELAKASILLTPFEDLRDNTPPVFPIGTESLIDYFKKNLPSEISIDICIGEDDYLEFAFYNNYKRLGKFVILSVTIPIFITVFSSYVYDNFIKEDESKPPIITVDNSTTITNKTTVINNPPIKKVIDSKSPSEITQKKFLQPTHIKFTVTVVDSTGTSKEIDYEGPANEVGTALNALKEYEGK